MTRPLDPSQTELVSRANIRLVTMVRLQLYIDRAQKVPGDVFYLSDKSVRYDYGVTGTVHDFIPFVATASPYDNRMVHVPSPSDSLPYTASQTVTISNDLFDGVRASKALERADGDILNASLQLSQLFVADLADLPDLSGLTGDEHTVLFDGRVERMTRVKEESFDLECAIDLPDLSQFWVVANSPTTNDPRDLGQRLPVPYGSVTHLPCLGLVVGWTTTLAQRVSVFTTGPVEVTDTSGLPQSGSFNVRIGNEEVTASVLGIASINVTARGQNGTAIAPHNVGEVMLEAVATAVWGVAGVSVESVEAFYFENPVVQGELVRVDQARYAVDLADTATIAGKTITSVAITTVDLGQVLSEMFTNVDFQAAVADIRTESLTNSEVLDDPFSTFDHDFTLTGTTPGTMQWFGGAPNSRDQGRSWWSTTGSVEAVSRWRLILEYDYNTLGGQAQLQLAAYVHNVPGFPNTSFPGTADILDVMPPGTSQSNVMLFSDWHQPPGGTTIADLISPSGVGSPSSFDPLVDLKVTNRSGVWLPLDLVGFNVVDVQMEVEVPSASGSVRLRGATIGFGLRGYADVRGIPAPGAGYQSSPGLMMEHPADLMKHWVEAVGNETADDATYQALVTALGVMAKGNVDMRVAGDQWADGMQLLSYNARANTVKLDTIAGRLWRFLSSDQNFLFPRPVAQLTQWVDVQDDRRDLAEIATDYTFAFDFDGAPVAGVGEQAYRQLAVANGTTVEVFGVTVPEMAAAVARFGNILAAPAFLRALSDLATAQQVAGWLVRENIAGDRSAITVSGVPWYEGFQRTLGDIVDIVAPGDFSLIEPMLVDDMETLSTWLGINGTASLETTIVQQGFGSILLTSDAADTRHAMWRETPQTWDTRGTALEVFVYIPQATFDAMDTAAEGLEVRISEVRGGPQTTNYSGYFIRRAVLVPDEWQSINIPVDQPDTEGSVAPAVLSMIALFELGWNESAGPTAGLDIYFDFMTLDNELTPCRVIGVRKPFASELWDMVLAEVLTEPANITPVVPPDPPAITSIETFDSRAASYTPTAQATLADEAVITVGGGSLRLQVATTTFAPLDATAVGTLVDVPVDLTGVSSVDIWIAASAAMSSILDLPVPQAFPVVVELHSSLGVRGWEFYGQALGSTFPPDTLVKLNLNPQIGDTGSGTFDISLVIQLTVGYRDPSASALIDSNPHYLYFDEMEVPVPPIPGVLESYDNRAGSFQAPTFNGGTMAFADDVSAPGATGSVTSLRADSAAGNGGNTLRNGAEAIVVGSPVDISGVVSISVWVKFNASAFAKMSSGPTNNLIFLWTTDTNLNVSTPFWAWYYTKAEITTGGGADTWVQLSRNISAADSVNLAPDATQITGTTITWEAAIATDGSEKMFLDFYEFL